MAILVTNNFVLLRVVAEGASQEWTQKKKMYFLSKESIFQQNQSLVCTGFCQTLIFLSEEL